MPGAPLSILQEILRRRGTPTALPAPPDPTAETMPGVDGGEIERWYAELMKPPTTFERIAAGVQVPTGPIRKQAPGRMFLRGLVGGFKGSAALDRGAVVGGERGSSLRSLQGRRAGSPLAAALMGRGGGRYVNPEYEAARTAAARALETERLARAAQTNEPTPEDPLLEDRRAALEALTGARNASAESARRRAAAYEKRMGRAPAARGGGGGGGASLTQERMLLDRKRIAELERLRGVITNMFGAPPGKYANDDATMAYGRAAARVEADYRRRIEELAAKYGMGAAGDYGEDEDELY